MINYRLQSRSRQLEEATVMQSPFYLTEFIGCKNYISSKIGSRYDAFIFIDETKALTPLDLNATGLRLKKGKKFISAIKSEIK